MKVSFFLFPIILFSNIITFYAKDINGKDKTINTKYFKNINSSSKIYLTIYTKNNFTGTINSKLINKNNEVLSDNIETNWSNEKEKNITYTNNNKNMKFSPKVIVDIKYKTILIKKEQNNTDGKFAIVKKLDINGSPKLFR